MKRLHRFRLPATPLPVRRARGVVTAEDTWDRRTRQSRRWAAWGAAFGGLVAVCVWAPAAWLSSVVNHATDGRVLLARPEGTVWTGRAALVLSGGSGSRDAATLPGLLQWSLRPQWNGLRLALAQDCCIHGRLQLDLLPGFGQWQARLARPDAPARLASTDSGTLGHSPGVVRMAQWPASLLSGLGTPWNTLQPEGTLELSSPGLTFTWSQGRMSLDGSVTVELRDFASRLSTLPRLGTYRFEVQGDAHNAGTAQVRLSTVDGDLKLEGQGSWSASGMRLRGEASASPDSQAALDNLLNIIGRRRGARSLLTIG